MSFLAKDNNERISELIAKGSFEDSKQLMADEYKKKFTGLKKADEAFLNSILSYAVYEQNSWMFENISSDLSDMGAIFNDAIQNNDKMYDLKIWHYMKNTFEKISDSELNMPSTGKFTTPHNYQLDYSFEDGQYSSHNKLAHASILKSKNPKGDGEILHLSFRGTEFSKLLKYAKGPYLDMSAYYESFKPLIENIREYVNNSENNIIEIHVNGHSLGGAMVQEFLKNNPPESFKVPVKGFTFGSPGSEKKWYHKFSILAYHTIGRGVSIDKINSELNKPSINDERITQYYHKNDPVPLVGLLGYVKGGNNYALPDVAYKDDKDAHLEKENFLEKIPAFGKVMIFFKEHIANKFNKKFHDSKRYIMNLRNYLEDNYEDPHFGSLFTFKHTLHWQNWRKHEKNFSTLSIKYKSAFEYLIKQNNPEINEDKLSEKVLEIRQRMKFDSQSDVVLSKFKNINGHYDDYDLAGIRGDNLKFNNDNKVTHKYINNDGTPFNTILQNGQTNETSITVSAVDQSLERIKRMRKLYEEKMEVRAAIFKKPN
jgi:hypothetical protein